jgi:hypothetical protein
MLSREVIKGEQPFFVFFQAVGCFWVLGLVTGAIIATTLPRRVRLAEIGGAPRSNRAQARPAGSSRLGTATTPRIGRSPALRGFKRRGIAAAKVVARHWGPPGQSLALEFGKAGR